MLGKELMKARVNLGLTQKDIADALGMTVNAISSWERGVSLPKLTFSQTYKLTLVLKKPLKELAEIH